ncbi:CLUMA_CG007359, isoform A [Clunio marinus]|uniref:CLUMA_CG007359, isoform A n=1 Tax=Clunio marinus TaxID=568069 RepID=A0A1J1I0G9_9DIPT|nr:CLUMA_CG007359, isoform A [Clunio marinus]
MDELGVSRGFSPHFSPSRNLSSIENQQQLYIHLPNHGFRMIKIDEVADVKTIVSLLVGSMSTGGGAKANPQYYALRLRHMVTKEIVWLPQTTLTRQVIDYISNESCSNLSCPNFIKTSPTISDKNLLESKENVPLGNSNCVWKIELRVRYIPKSLNEFLERDKISMNFYFNQVKDDFIQANLPNIDQEIAVQLCCLSIRHYYKDARSSNDRKQHLDYIEKEIGFSNFLPKSVIDTIKHKNLKKLIQNQYKKIYQLSDTEYVLKYFEQLGTIFDFDHEKFVVTLGQWNIAIDLIIGYNMGISYLTHAEAKPTKVTDFENILSLRTSMLPILQQSTITSSSTSGKSLQNSKSNDSNISQSASGCSCSTIKSQLRIQVDGNTEDLAITCNGVNVADGIADLVDGYCKIFNENNLSVWDRSVTPMNTNSLEKKNSFQNSMMAESSQEMFESLPKLPMLVDDYSELHGVLPDVDEEGDYSTPTARNYELHRGQIVLSEIIGIGQFGDVYIGTCRIIRSASKKDQSAVREDIVAVAVKTCKADADLKTSEKFLEEAYVMQKFEHPHIIRLIGICSDAPIWIVMELARLGELRAYLKENSSKEILLEEKVSDSETMKRENRRIAAMSWGGVESDEPPPKPSRTPLTDSTSKLFQLSTTTNDGERTDNGTGDGMTYIVAQNPAILAKLMRENEKRGVNPSAYTTPASVFNVLAVEFDQTTEKNPADDIPLKVSKIPAMDLMPLKQDKLDIFEKCQPQQSLSTSQFSNSQISGNEGECNEASFVVNAALPPQPPDAKSKSLERNLNQNVVFARMNSLERRQQQQQSADYSMKTGQRSQSLIRQFSAGIQQADNAALRSASLERNQQLPLSFKGAYSSSFEKFQQNPPPPYVRPGGSLERSQAIIMNDLMRKYYDQKALSDAMKPRSGGSLERNVQYQQYLFLQKQQLQQQLHAQQQQAQVHQQQALAQQQQAQRQEELIEENIYDFGGVHVKSCATIALKKSIERGMVPPNVMVRPTIVDSSSGPSSLEIRPTTPQATLKQPCPGIASRIMMFQQGVQPPKSLPTHIQSTTLKTFSNPNLFNLQNDSMIPSKDGPPQQVHQNQELHNFIEARLRKQQEESEKDSRWLQQQEDNIKKRLSIASLNDVIVDSSGQQIASVTVKPPIAEKPPLSPRVLSESIAPIPSTSSSSSPQGSEKKTEAKADRKNDPVYLCTTNVVRAVMKLSSGVEKSQIDDYLELVKTVGLELRTLLGTVDLISSNFPPITHKEVEMAHKVLSKDMKDLVASMHRAIQYCDTTLDVECRKNMLSSAHILAMDTKNLLDVCDSIRSRYPNVKYELPEGSMLVKDSTDEQQNARLPQQCSSQQEAYENLATTERIEITEQIYCNQTPPTDIGIYDNQAAIQEQLKIIEEPTSPVDGQFNSQKILIN